MTPGWLAFRRFWGEPLWTTIRLLVLMLAAAMSIFMLSLNREYSEGPLRYLQSLNRVDWWVVAEGSDSLAANSTIPPDVVEQLRGRGEPTTVYWNTLNDNDVLLQTYQPGGVLGPELAEGLQVQNDSEVVLDHVVADAAGVGVGDQVMLIGQRFEVVGLSNNTNSHSTSLVFLTPTALRQAASFAPVSAVAGSGNQPALDEAGVEVVSQQEFVDSNREYWAEKTSAPILLVVVVTVLAMALITGAFLMLDLQVHRRQKGILKSISTFGPIRLTERFLLVYSLLASAVLAVPLAFGLIALGNWAVAGTSASLQVSDVLWTYLLLAVAATLASLWPMRQLKKQPVVELLR